MRPRVVVVVVPVTADHIFLISLSMNEKRKVKKTLLPDTLAVNASGLPRGEDRLTGEDLSSRQK